MAGSYQHLVDKDPSEFSFCLIENMGDAHEACEHCYHMIQWLSGEMAKGLAMTQKKIIEDASKKAYDAMYPTRKASTMKKGFTLPELAFGIAILFAMILGPWQNEKEKLQGMGVNDTLAVNVAVIIDNGAIVYLPPVSDPDTTWGE